MGVVTHIMNYTELYNAVQSTGTWDTIAEAVEAGAVYVENGKAINGLYHIQGGAGAPVIDFAKSALEVSKNPSILARAAEVGTAAVTAAIKSGKVALMGLATLEVPAVAAAASPLAGVALGYGLYETNPELWTKISKTLLPFCYDNDKIEAFVDFITDDQGNVNPVMLIPTAIIDALKGLFEDEGVHTDSDLNIDSPNGSVTLVHAPESFVDQTTGKTLYKYEGDSYVIGYSTTQGENWQGIYSTSNVRYRSNDIISPQIATISRGYTEGGRIADYYNIPLSGLTERELRGIIDGQTSSEIIPPTAGVSAPTTPVKPIVWPDTPIIVVPDPLGPDYQPIPVTPITPLPLPAPDPVPLLPEHVPDPTPEKPEEWPEEDPWPTVVPFPIQPTEPDPDWPTIMPWPLPPEQPEEWPLSPEVPKKWPEEFPSTEPWPHSPEQWPEEVPWPDHAPEDWPEGVPWPDNPEEWPETVPWPVPWPEEWPETAPWPIKWPDELPYPWPFPYPKQSPDPYPDPQTIEDPDKQVDPYIDPWPFQWPDPFPSPKPDQDPYRDPSQPESKPEIDPDPQPTPQQPSDPYPTPPEGTINPPPVPIIPLPFSSTTGLISVYHPTQGELLSFAQWLWVTWQDATIEKIWNNPFDGVITLFELYCTPTDVGRKNIRSGFLDSGVSSETISRYTELNCGSIGIPEFYGNYFDYAPYSKCHIFLPFIGIVELNVDDVVGHGVNVTYRIDEYNGSCIAMITCAKSTVVNGIPVDYSTIVYQFSGNCAVELPIAGGSQAAIKAGMLEAAAWGLGSVIGGIMGGNSPMQIGQGLAYGAASAVHSVVSAKSSVQHSGSFGSSYGAMGGKKPYIIVTRPKQIQVPNYNELYGYQAHKMVKVGDCTGYLRCREVHVISPTASDEEKAQIEQLMKMGVYVTE